MSLTDGGVSSRGRRAGRAGARAEWRRGARAPAVAPVVEGEHGHAQLGPLAHKRVEVRNDLNGGERSHCIKEGPPTESTSRRLLAAACCSDHGEMLCGPRG